MAETHPQNRRFGYARVSTYGQTLDSQLEQLRAAGCTSRNIYREKVTGAHSDRRQLLRMLGKLAPGDVVTVTRIDRLARSTFDLFGIVKRIVDDLASAYALKGETERAIIELAEARKLSGDGRYSSFARLKALQYWGVPNIEALYEATYFAGLRKAGMPEE